MEYGILLENLEKLMTDNILDQELSTKFPATTHKQTMLFLQSENELLQDQVTSLQHQLFTKNKNCQSVQDKLNDALLLIREKDTEIRILNKEKESLTDKLMD